MKKSRFTKGGKPNKPGHRPWRALKRLGANNATQKLRYDEMVGEKQRLAQEQEAA